MALTMFNLNKSLGFVGALMERVFGTNLFDTNLALSIYTVHRFVLIAHTNREVAQVGLSVPPRLSTISTEACNEYVQIGKKLPSGLWDEILEGLQYVQQELGSSLGDLTKPLLISVRSGVVLLYITFGIMVLLKNSKKETPELKSESKCINDCNLITSFDCANILKNGFRNDDLMVVADVSSGDCRKFNVAILTCFLGNGQLGWVLSQAGTLGGPSWKVKLGRRDSETASRANANANLPSPFMDLPSDVKSVTIAGELTHCFIWPEHHMTDIIVPVLEEVLHETKVEDTWKALTNVIAIGIGESFLGPLFVHTALPTVETVQLTDNSPRRSRFCVSVGHSLLEWLIHSLAYKIVCL
ncbi:hypothetical protein CTI12_AA372170 [Artemisia annua]|uniref:Plant heme peroxidase family profile domain-containing protein n=1 Tax=Artemisia annua TaxID=35608 RepID=A0A2U1MA05_ARTAN|nr:hypothetical protein CTI12_AA372170 [Artemisia annua]